MSTRSSTRSTRSPAQRKAETQRPTIVLKTLLDDIVKANPQSTLTTKKMRVVLRAKMNDVHTRNSSWIFTDAEYARARSLFDPAFADRQTKAAKRAAKPAKVATPKPAKVATPTPAEEPAE